jgi:hypothetical protein
VHPSFERRDRIARVAPVLRAHNHRVHRLEQRLHLLEEPDAEVLGRLPSPGRVSIRNPDEVRRSEFDECGGVRRGVDVGEADDADPYTHPTPPSVTGLPVRTDCVAASPILSAS